MMQATDKPSTPNLMLNILNGVVGMVGGRDVIDHEKHTRQRLQDKEEQRGGAEDIVPAGTSGNGLVQEGLLQRL